MRLIYLAEPDNFPEESIKRLSLGHKVVTTLDEFDEKDVRVVFVRLAQFIGESLHSQFPSLEYLVSPTTGVNHIDINYFRDQGIKVITLRGHTSFLNSIYATSENTLALALALFRKIPQADQSVRTGNWNRDLFKGRELNGKKVLVLGYGRIGTQVSALYDAFGCQVMAVDLDGKKIPSKYQCEFGSAISECDVLSIHLDLVPDNVKFVGDKILSLMKKTSVIINTSRGEIIDQELLFAYLKNKRIAGAALDVLEGEPAPISTGVKDILELCGDRLLITPHISGLTHESLPKVEQFITTVLLAEMAMV